MDEVIPDGTDIVKVLRIRALGSWTVDARGLLNAAADEIERLRGGLNAAACYPHRNGVSVSSDIIFRLNAHAMALSDLARKNAEQAMLDAAAEIGRLRCLIVRFADDLAIVEDTPAHVDIQAYDDTVEVLRAEANRIKGSGSWPLDVATACDGGQ